ncbi:DinB family protein [Brevibacillus sp. H7]|uniref:DinB family protein n=1 Tax=Brevibacillus sp. H7 TaxID=3349138 RepID=UPI003806C7CF
MNRMELLLHELELTFDKEGWFPPLKDALKGLTAAQASWRPPGEAANTIWETVNHMLFYKERLLQVIQGIDPIHTANSNDDTFAVDHTVDDEEAWQATINRAERIQRELHNLLSAMSDADFDRLFSQTSLGLSTFNIIMHDAFHTGQIVQTRKLQGSWPARRSFD